MNDLPSCRSVSEVFLFADDTNICGMACDLPSLEKDLSCLSQYGWQIILYLNDKKTVFFNFKRGSSSTKLLKFALQS